MNTLKSTQTSTARLKQKTNQQMPFLYAEECGLALFLNCRNGRKFYLDQENWDDLEFSLKHGWKPV